MMNRLALLLAVVNGALAFSPAGSGFLPGRAAVSPASARVSTSSVEMMVRSARAARSAQGAAPHAAQSNQQAARLMRCGLRRARASVRSTRLRHAPRPPPSRSRAPPRAPLSSRPVRALPLELRSGTPCAVAASAGRRTSARRCSAR